MKKIIPALLTFLYFFSFAQYNPGDTIKVNAFKYGSASRDTGITFPNGSYTYEKIILKYNMRCKNGLISNQSFPNQGCGEWDYSCNTFLVDSGRVENELNYAPNYMISGFTGTTFPYSNSVIHDYYTYSQTNVILNNILSESQYTLSAGSNTLGTFLPANEHSARSQVLYTAAELTAAGLTAGNIDGLLLNVTNAGGGTNFFNVGIKHTPLSSLSSGTVSVTSFTNVVSTNMTFTTGINRLQFYTPFSWDGTSNVLIDFSFTNTVPSNPIIFSASSTPGVMLISTKNNYALSLENYGKVTINPSQFGSISNEITVAFWVYGNSSLLPSNSTLMYGWSNDPTQRQLNFHLPWNNSNVYFDAGYSAGAFDRINKVATASEMGGQWNHWAFTKNAITGNMKTYLNGVLWNSGTGKTKAMSILNLILGNSSNSNENYKGKINELSIWNAELSANDIQAWMVKPLDNTHPFYGNLQSYYPMSEGTGSVINEAKNALTSNGVNMQWTYDRGNKLNRSFGEYTMRPDITLLRGTYSLTTNTIVTKDSIARNPNTVNQYSIVSNATVTPMAADVVTLTTTQSLYYCSPIATYNGDLGTLTSTTAATPQGTITITQMPYYKRYPYFNELVSFVTPYGKGLDLGINGKTWLFDVSDFEPLLKNKKRLVMNMGGQNQEQMDLEFWFIVGTPPRTVMNFNQLWQGVGRAGEAAIATIISDTRYNTQTVTATPGAQAFKLRSTITGHGSEGEFHQNGGVMTHYFNIDGGPVEFSWPITQACGYNPIVAQGGTWIYDRQGWCPGQASLTKEYNLTPYLVAGNTHTLDYTISNPAVSGGDYRYLEAHQLVSYGGPNHTADARILEVKKPSNMVLYSKTNPICQQPLVLVQNSGSTNISSIEFDYWVNNATSKQTYTWTGNLAYMDTTHVKLPIGTLWQNGLQPSGNVFYAEIKKINGAADTYTVNNKYISPFTLPPIITNSFSIEFHTNNYYTHNAYTLTDDNGNIVGSSNFTAANTTYLDSYVLNGCYKLKVTDLGNDGLQWWANTAQGNGWVRIKNSFGAIIQNFNSDFGSFFEFSFTTTSATGIGENSFGHLVNIYPNPAKEKLVIEGDELPGSSMEMFDMLGHLLMKQDLAAPRNTIELGNFAAGVYFVKVQKEGQAFTRKIVVN